ncbi:hypothetical protein [Marinobacter sp. CHS3-4]|uniref:hypothetical protein n=1 Tax=Marinobacter sp. CHS3-4 TaxID=3045174 RepID=UPI0024B5C40C|nr:hypothetical protein [Marinobacter sp. CHS3-4]MDI9245377.1 hypothetical protein [Marinobacter sp. CHS3-4]
MKESIRALILGILVFVFPFFANASNAYLDAPATDPTSEQYSEVTSPASLDLEELQALEAAEMATGSEAEQIVAGDERTGIMVAGVLLFVGLMTLLWA